MKNFSVDKVMVIYNRKLENDCTLKFIKDNDSKSMNIIKDKEEIIVQDFKLPVQIHTKESSNWLLIDSFNIQFKFLSLSDLRKCVEWIQEACEKKPTTCEEKLVNQIFIDSFERSITLENVKLKMRPEDYIFSKIEAYWQNPTEFFGYFTTICQSSGFGKSKACQNLSKKAYVVFSCLRYANSDSVYPKPSYLAHKLTQLYANENLTRQYYINYFNMFIDFLNQNESFSYQEFYKKFSNGFDAQSSFDQHQSLVNHELDKLEQNCPQTNKLIYYQSNKPLIFVFDEASSLLKPDPYVKQKDQKLKPNYFIMRNLISEFNKDKKIFVLFLDTLSSLSNFMPNKWVAESLLIEPIYLLPNWDVHLDIEAIQTPQESLLFENICSFGRPMWGSWCKTKKSDKKYEQVGYSELISFAMKKLVGGFAKKLEKLTDNDALAILSCRLGAVRPLLTSTAQNLVAMNMAVCTFANHDENLFKIEYPSEPILANSAAFYFNQTKTYENKTQSGLCFFVNKLVQAVQNTIIDQGEKGETITKILLLNAYDTWVNRLQIDDPIVSTTRYCSYVKVEYFLSTLYGQIALDIVQQQLGQEQSEKLLNGFVRFNHFVRAQCSKEKLNLKNLMKRCCAVQCMSKEPGVDFVIPVIYSLNDDSFDRMSVILVQTKLNAIPKKVDITKLQSARISRSEIETPFLVIYMQLGKFEETFVHDIGSKPKNRAVIYSEGISTKVFCSIDSDTETALVNFSKSQNCSYLTGIDNSIAKDIAFSSDLMLSDNDC